MKLYFYLLFFLLTNTTISQYSGPISSISNGYGADGVYSVTHIDITNDHWFLKKISIFYPTGISSPVPTIFYSHGYASTDTTYHIETLKHIVSRGYAVVFVPYKPIGADNTERYATLFDGFVKAARNNPLIIDTTRVGFFGQSFGGGATPRIAYRAFTENNWGANGKFIYCSAPWYSLELGATSLSNFPTDCKMLTVLYDDDLTNDHRMGMDIFNNIAIHDSIKDCLIAYSDSISGYHYNADHNMPSQYTNNGEFDALDYYITFRLMDALADYTFTGNLSAKDVALGNGSTAQTFMGGQLPNLTSSNNPIPIYPESGYTNPCIHATNQRQVYCQATVDVFENNLPSNIKIFPNPTTNKIQIELINQYNEFSLSLFNAYGKLISKSKNKHEVDLSNLSNGIYFITVQVENDISTHKIVKE